MSFSPIARYYAEREELPMSPSCNSWVVVSRETGKAVLETYSRVIAVKPSKLADL